MSYRLAVISLALLVLGLINFSIFEKETLLAEGQTVYLELVPVDPRSLMQGDYMRLNYRLGRELSQENSKLPVNGQLAVQLDEHRVARQARWYKAGSSLAADEIRLQYRKRGSRDIYLGARSFFFQEGHADWYSAARYGELRVDAHGASLLVGLRDAELQRLGPLQEEKKSP